jgi:hypothetical protein
MRSKAMMLPTKRRNYEQKSKIQTGKATIAYQENKEKRS